MVFQDHTASKRQDRTRTALLPLAHCFSQLPWQYIPTIISSTALFGNKSIPVSSHWDLGIQKSGVHPLPSWRWRACILSYPRKSQTVPISILSHAFICDNAAISGTGPGSSARWWDGDCDPGDKWGWVTGKPIFGVPPSMTLACARQRW